jgi:(p)ppGpp synthase/HD superfamily hydrolase
MMGNERFTENENVVIIAAALYAAIAHGEINHRRKYTDEPYIVHPIAVAKKVEEVGGDHEMVAAAYLHDVVEDTEYTYEDIKDGFGKAIADLVNEVTDVSISVTGNRAFRKNLDLEHLAKASDRAKTIKLADIGDNTKSIMKYDRGFAKLYMEEKRKLLPVLVGGNVDLMNHALKVLADWDNFLSVEIA